MTVGVVLAMTGCGAAEEPGPTAAETPSATPTSPATGAAEAPCDPGGGWPKPRPGCPDPHPETGWLTGDRGDGRLLLGPFRTLTNDANGEAYAEAHDLEFPFANDYYDAPAGTPHPFTPAATTVCTGILAVGYREPLEDHVVDCADLVAVAGRRGLAVAVWHDGSAVVQVSELYRP